MQVNIIASVYSEVYIFLLEKLCVKTYVKSYGMKASFIYVI